jgi:hypothetical protein
MVSAKAPYNTSSEDEMRSASLICAAVSPLAPAWAIPRADQILSGEKNKFWGERRSRL